jgi:hypothetical protein
VGPKKIAIIPMLELIRQQLNNQSLTLNPLYKSDPLAPYEKINKRDGLLMTWLRERHPGFEANQVVFTRQYADIQIAVIHGHGSGLHFGYHEPEEMAQVLEKCLKGSEGTLRHVYLFSCHSFDYAEKLEPLLTGTFKSVTVTGMPEDCLQTILATGEPRALPFNQASQYHGEEKDAKQALASEGPDYERRLEAWRQAHFNLPFPLCPFCVVG